MALKVGINGFGRIGRMVLRSIIENNRKDLEVVTINNRGNSEVSSFLLKHDTIHGKLKAKISHSEKLIEINGKKINISNFVIATFTLAFGTTIPELAVSINAILSIPPHPGIAVGNIFGSNIANILLILGVSSLIFPIKINYDKSIKIETRINFLIIFFLFI